MDDAGVATCPGPPVSAAPPTKTFERTIAAVCHELRTPLTALSGALSLLMEGSLGALSNDQQGFAQLALRNARRLEHLINSVLAASRASRGEWPVEPIPSRLGPLVRAGVDEAREGGPAGVAVEIAEAPDLPLTPADPEGVRRIVKNLVANAMRFSAPSGRVVVGLRAAPGAVVIEVTDSGPGVAPADRAWIFERFHQVPMERGGRPRGGLGLGLYLSLQIARAHGGDLQCVEPTVGRGACFRLTLPNAPTDAGRGRVSRVRIARPDGGALRASETFRAAEALRAHAPGARRWELRSAVVGELPEAPRPEHEAITARLGTVLGEGLQVRLETAGGSEVRS